MANTQIGIQLIIFGRRTSEDVHSVLKAVRAGGYAGVEAGRTLARDADAAKDLLRNYSLQLTGAHSGFGEFEDQEKLKANVEFLNQMGAKYLMCSGVAAGDNLDAYRRSAEVFNHAGQYCRDHGVSLCYHNHNWEFKRFPGQNGGEVVAIHELCRLTDPELVKLCIDVYWVAVGGEDPAQFLHRYANRAAYYHFKDGEWEQGTPGKATKFLPLGQGKVDLQSALAAALKTNPDWIVTEQDSPNERDPGDCARESRETLKALGI